MPLEKRKEYQNKNWDFFRTHEGTRELLLSNDGRYIFHCKFQLGNFEADRGNLQKVCKRH